MYPKFVCYAGSVDQEAGGAGESLPPSQNCDFFEKCTKQGTLYILCYLFNLCHSIPPFPYSMGLPKTQYLFRGPWLYDMYLNFIFMKSKCICRTHAFSDLGNKTRSGFYDNIRWQTTDEFLLQIIFFFDLLKNFIHFYIHITIQIFFLI